MSLTFALLAGLTVGSAVGAMSLRNLVHCALSLAVSLAGLAALYLHLNAEFLGFVQVLVYIGAVAILIVFALLLTRGTEAPSRAVTNSPVVGSIVAVAVFCVLAAAILNSVVGKVAVSAPPAVSVRAVGEKLMGEFVIPLEIIGLLLTAAMIGAVIIALRDKENGK